MQNKHSHTYTRCARNDTSTFPHIQRSGPSAVGGYLYRVEVADTLTAPWSSGTTLVEQIGPTINNGDGTETVTVRLKQAVSGTTQNYLRLVLVPAAP